MRKGFLAALVFLFLFHSVWAVRKLSELEIAPDALASDYCDDLFAIINRPTAGDSPCSVDPGQVLVEGGAQYFKYKDNGTGWALPNVDLRFGIPGGNEFALLLPNYQTQTTPSTTGASAGSLLFRHEVTKFQNGIFSLEGILTLPSGSSAFGSKKGGVIVNGLGGYNFTDEIGVDMGLGLGTQSLPTSDGGASFFTLNPDLILTWRPLKPLQFYGEVWGQTNTGPGQGAGYNGQVGIQYLVTRDIELDLEQAVSLTGQLAGFVRYTGFGMAVMF